MPANSIRIASASEGTLLKWLKGLRVYTEISVKLNMHEGEPWIATAWDRYHDTGFIQGGKTPLAALRKLCREVRKQEAV